MRILSLAQIVLCNILGVVIDIVANYSRPRNSLHSSTWMISGFNNSMVRQTNSLQHWGNALPLAFLNDSGPWVQRMAERLRSNSSEKLYFSFGHDVSTSMHV